MDSTVTDNVARARMRVAVRVWAYLGTPQMILAKPPLMPNCLDPERIAEPKEMKRCTCI